MKPFLKSQKNDANDAKEISEVVVPTCDLFPANPLNSKTLQTLHRVRSRLIGCCMQLGIRFVVCWLNTGLWFPLYLSHVRNALPQLIEAENSLLSGTDRQLLAGLYEELCALKRRIEAMDEQIHRIHQSNILCQRIDAIEGVGPVIATAVVAAIADGRSFHNGRQFAALAGLFRDSIPVARSTGSWASPNA